MPSPAYTRKDLDPNLYTVVWIAPLEIETQAAQHMLDKEHDGQFPEDSGDYTYIAGEMCGHNVIIATFPAGQVYGTAAAAALASHIKITFRNIHFGLLVGVAAGLPQLLSHPPRDIRLGDVLVALPDADNAAVVAYDLGKDTATGFQILRRGHSMAATSLRIGSAIGMLKRKAPKDTECFVEYYKNMKHEKHELGDFDDPGQDQDYLYDSTGQTVSRNPRPVERRTRVWYGPIGSGDKLMKNAQIRDQLRDEYNVIGLEMEAAGTMNTIPVGVIRGVCDYGDAHKNKQWQPYAAAMAAAYAKAVLYRMPLPRAVGPSCQAPSSQAASSQGDGGQTDSTNADDDGEISRHEVKGSINTFFYGGNNKVISGAFSGGTINM